MNRTIAPLALALAALSAALVGQAFAHAAYQRSVPNAGEVVTTAPTRLDAYFTQDIRREAGTYDLAVSDHEGNRVDNGDVTIDDDDRRHMSVTLRPDLPPGTYHVEWKTFSDEDGEADDGMFTFTIAAAALPSGGIAGDAGQATGTAGAWPLAALGLASLGALLLVLGACRLGLRERTRGPAS